MAPDQVALSPARRHARRMRRAAGAAIWSLLGGAILLIGPSGPYWASGGTSRAQTTATSTLAVTVSATWTATLGPTRTATATGTATVTGNATAAATFTETATATATGSTSTAEATLSVTATATASATLTPPTRLAPVLLPYLSRGAKHESKPRRVWGLQFQLDFLPERLPENVIVDLPRAKAAGVGSVRTNLRWELVEPQNTEPNEFDWSIADRLLEGYSGAGFDIILSVVHYPRWAVRYGCGGGLLPGMEAEWRQFVRAAAERYGDGYNIAAWEIGNEPDGTSRVDTDDWTRPPGWGQGEPTGPHGGCWAEMPVEYARFLHAAAEEIRAVDPDGLVTYGGLAYQDWAKSFDLDFVNNILAAGAGPSIDVHNYHSFAHFWTMPGQPTGVEKHTSFVNRLRLFGEDKKPVWLTESYRATFDADPNSPALQIPYLTRDLVELLAFPELERVYWFGWVDGPSDIGDEGVIGRGIIWPDRTPKPALDILPYTIDYTNGDPRDLSIAGARIVGFSRPRVARRTYVAWSTDGDVHRVAIGVPSGWRARKRRFPVDDVMAGRCCSVETLAVDNGQVAIDIGQESVFVEIFAP